MTVIRLPKTHPSSLSKVNIKAKKKERSELKSEKVAGGEDIDDQLFALRDVLRI